MKDLPIEFLFLKYYNGIFDLQVFSPDYLGYSKPTNDHFIPKGLKLEDKRFCLINFNLNGGYPSDEEGINVLQVWVDQAMEENRPEKNLLYHYLHRTYTSYDLLYLYQEDLTEWYSRLYLEYKKSRKKDIINSYITLKKIV